MKKNINKADVLAACVQNKEQSIANFENRLIKPGAMPTFKINQRAKAKTVPRVK